MFFDAWDGLSCSAFHLECVLGLTSVILVASFSLCVDDKSGDADVCAGQCSPHVRVKRVVMNLVCRRMLRNIESMVAVVSDAIVSIVFGFVFAAAWNAHAVFLF